MDGQGWNIHKKSGWNIQKKGWNIQKKGWNIQKKGWNIHKKSGWNIQKKDGTFSKIHAISSLNNQLDKSFFL